MKIHRLITYVGSKEALEKQLGQSLPEHGLEKQFPELFKLIQGD